MKHRHALVAALLAAACDGGAPIIPGLVIEATAGDGQSTAVGTAVASPLEITVTTSSGSPAAGIPVTWSPSIGSGSVTPVQDTTDAAGISTATYTTGGLAGQQLVRASVEGYQPVTFIVTATPGPATAITVVAGNAQNGQQNSPLAVPLQARVADAFGNAVAGSSVAWAVTQGTGTLSSSTSLSNLAGVATVNLTPTSAGTVQVTATIVGGPNTVFSATVAVGATLVAEIPFTLGYHDQYVRDGIAFLAAWDHGLRIYDIGGGGRGGVPGAPVLIGSITTNANGVPGGVNVHNAWWYHAPDGQKRYVFVGQEGSGSVPVSSSGDIHVVDITNTAAPVEVAFYHLPGAGVHNFWVDEQNEVLFAAYYNGGIVALNIAGTLTGDLASREIARVQPGGAGNTFIWGVQLYGGFLYATDMQSGFWQLRFVNNAFQILGGGNNVAERWGSDQWVHGGYAYSGTWFRRAGTDGNALKIWRLDAAGAPVLADSIITPNVGTISDVEVSSDGKLLMFSAENGPNAGIHFYDLTVSPTRPRYIGRYATSNIGVHTATFTEIGGRRYVVAARNSPLAAIILDVTAIGP